MRFKMQSRYSFHTYRSNKQKRISHHLDRLRIRLEKRHRLHGILKLIGHSIIRCFWRDVLFNHEFNNFLSTERWFRQKGKKCLIQTFEVAEIDIIAAGWRGCVSLFLLFDQLSPSAYIAISIVVAINFGLAPYNEIEKKSDEEPPSDNVVCDHDDDALLAACDNFYAPTCLAPCFVVGWSSRSCNRNMLCFDC